jgi:hypothetical protein
MKINIVDIILKYVKIIVALLFLFTSCKDDQSSLSTEDFTEVNEEFRLSADTSIWYLREKPDSIIVKIIAGDSPFSITQAPSFTSFAKIRKDSLIIYPNKFNSLEDSVGMDIITVEDNTGKSKNHIIHTDLLRFFFNSASNFSVEVYGDTIIKTTEISIKRAFWDKYDGVFWFEGRSGDISFTLIDTNLFTPKVIHPYQLKYEPSFSMWPNNNRFIPKDTSAVIEYKEVSRNNIFIEFDIPAKDHYNNFNGNVRLKGNIKLEE